MPKIYIVQAGDCISSIAFEHDFFPDTVWDAPDNAELRKLRGDPHVLMAGDRVVIPDKRQRWVNCATGARHRFVRKGVPELLQVRFELDGKPRANEPFQLEVDGVVIGSGRRTDSNGGISVAISPAARRARVLFGVEGDDREEHELELGHLDPIDTVSGVQGRLRNLGLFAGPIDGELSDDLTAAVQEFQAGHGLPPYGDIDDATRDAMRAACEAKQ